jgi:GNAT superfamily N-acetyltransferase
MARTATFDDVYEITELIKISIRVLGAEFYDNKTIESALQGAFGVDTQLIKDKSYFVIENNGRIIACAGWSFRKTLFGSDSNNLRNPEKLNPATDAAKIRAFFIHPNYARQGLGKVLLDTCEKAAQKHGFSKTELMSTLSGIQFYTKNGYQGSDYIQHDMGNEHFIRFLPMYKNLL